MKAERGRWDAGCAATSSACAPRPTSRIPAYDFFRVRWSTSPVLESRAACVESSDVIPRPITRRPLDDPDEPDALRLLPDLEEPEAFLALLLPLLFPRELELLLELPLELRAPLLELPFPPLALIPPLLRFAMLTLG